jgi:hypothetical protein
MLGGGDITCFVATAVFYKKIEDDIIITLTSIIITKR